MANKTLKPKELYEKEKELSEYKGDDRIVSSHELAEELKDTKDSEFIIPTGVGTYDRLHEGGAEAGELIIVTGPTGEGKTTLLMSITNNMVAKDVQSAWFTLEVTPRQFLKKMQKRGDKLPLFYMPRENSDENKLQWMEDRIIEAKVKHNVKVIFIDHLHELFSIDKLKGFNSSIEIGDVAGKIKRIALQHNLIVFMIAHNKDDPTGSTREPKKEDIRDSGLISRLADSIVGVWRVPNDAKITDTRRKAIEEDDIQAKVRIFKNRRTGKQGAWFMEHENHNLVEAHSDF